MDTVEPKSPISTETPSKPIETAATTPSPARYNPTPIEGDEHPPETPNPIEADGSEQGSSDHSNSTYPELIVYALIVYGFYFAAKYTKDAIMSSDPTAKGLFKTVQLQYKVALTDIDPNETATRDAVMSDLELLKQALDPETYAKVVGALDGDSEEKPVE